VRRQNDFYPTPEWATSELLKRVSIRGNVFECCVGDGAIAKALEGERTFIYTGDIDPQWCPMMCGDALDRAFWREADRMPSHLVLKDNLTNSGLRRKQPPK
jgi:hypothetical protein